MTWIKKWGIRSIGLLDKHISLIVIAIAIGIVAAADKIFESIFECFRFFIDDFAISHDHFHILLLRCARLIFALQNSRIE